MLRRVSAVSTLPYRLPSVSAAIDFPGFGNNPVGYDHTPASQPTVWSGGTWPGAYPGSLTAATIGDGTGGTYLLVSGSLGNPTIIAFKDFSPSGFGSNSINANGNGGGGQPLVHDITFVGCRFTANTNNTFPDACVSLFRDASYNITFSYCTMAPLTSVATHPVPATAWPSSSVGTGAVFTSTGPSGNTYQMQWGVTFQNAINVNTPAGKFIYLDHCDMWGWAEGVGGAGSPWTTLNTYPDNGQLNVTDCWIHDCRTDNSNADHSNILMTATNSNGASNMLFRHNTLSGLGNTETCGCQHPMTAGTYWQSATHYQFTGWFFFTGQPSAGNTITLNGTTVTYVASGATGNQINIGGSLATTVSNTSTFLNGSADAQISKSTYTNNGVNEVDIFFKDASGNASGYTLAVSGTNLSTSSVLTAPEVGADDGFAYRLLVGNTNNDPQSNAHPTLWQQFQINSYRNISFINNHISGMNNGIDMGIGTGGSQNMVCKDNIISNAVMYLNEVVTTSGSFNGPNGSNCNAMFNGTNGNLWLNNTYEVWPGSASWDAANAGNNGKYVWPDNSKNSSDWPN